VPKDTFYRLSEEKKRRIFDAAVREFSTRRFSEASLNQIVKAAKIPWGSFYQYFHDKEDIFRYMYDEILREKREVVGKKMDLDMDEDLLDLCVKANAASYEWARQNPRYSRISMLMEIDDSEFILKLRDTSFQSLRKMVERDQERGRIKPEIDPELVVDMMYMLLWKQFYLVGTDENLFMKKINDGIRIIREGIARG